MKAVLLRSRSVPIRSLKLPVCPKARLFRHDPGVFSSERTSSSSKISLHLETNGRRDRALIRRAMSEADVCQSESTGRSRCSQSIIPEEEHLSDVEVEDFLSSLMSKAGDWPSYAPIRPDNRIPIEELGFSGNGIGRSGNDKGKPGDGGGDGRFGDRSNKIGEYYREMLKLNPGDSLLLRNYGKYLYEVENDVEKAEECYGRAILASPGDGEVLSLYGKLIWETQKDEDRAKAYFDRAVFASPDDCMVLASYAHFMWEAEEDDVEQGAGLFSIN